MQENWIGKSNGLEFELHFDKSSTEKLSKRYESFKVFTTRADTIYGVTYCALAPEHEIVTYMIDNNLLDEDTISSIKAMKNANSIDRQKEKSGVALNISVIHPLTGKSIPVWVANFVLMDYGSGGVMAVPAHDDRDYEFASKYSLDIKPVIKPFEGELPEGKAFTDVGELFNSENFDTLRSDDAIGAVMSRESPRSSTGTPRGSSSSPRIPTISSRCTRK